MQKILSLLTLIICGTLFVANSHAAGIDFGAFSRGMEEGRRLNQEDYDREIRKREYERSRQREIDRQNVIYQYMKKFNETRDFRYLFIASEMGDAEASAYLISSGVFCGKNGGNITCSK